MLGAVYSEVLAQIKGHSHDIREKKGKRGPSINEILMCTCEGLDTMPIVDNAVTRMFYAMCVWLLDDQNHSSETLKQLILHKFEHYNLTRTSFLKVLFPAMSAVGVYAKSEDEARILAKKAQKALKPIVLDNRPNDTIVNTIVDLLDIAAAEYYITQYHNTAGSPESWDKTCLRSRTYTDEDSSLDTPSKYILGHTFYLTACDVQRLLIQVRKLGLYNEFYYATNFGSIDLSPNNWSSSLTGSFLFPIHDERMWPNLHARGESIVCRYMLPEDVELFNRFRDTVYLRHDFKMSLLG